MLDFYTEKHGSNKTNCKSLQSDVTYYKLLIAFEKSNSYSKFILYIASYLKLYEFSYLLPTLVPSYRIH